MLLRTLWDFLFAEIKLRLKKNIYHFTKYNSMKTVFIALVCISATFTSSAQIERKKAANQKADTATSATAGEPADKESRRDRMKELDLTKDQRIKLKEIRQANSAAKTAIENNDALSESEKKKQLRALQKDQAQKIQAILTPEQIEKFKASRQNNL